MDDRGIRRADGDAGRLVGAVPQVFRLAGGGRGSGGHYEMANKINQSISAFVYRLFRPYPKGRRLRARRAVSTVTVLIHATSSLRW
jgi:hypothetical protein